MKTAFPILTIWLSAAIVTVVNARQEVKAESAILVTDLGICTLETEVHSVNALFPMLVMPSEIMICFTVFALALPSPMRPYFISPVPERVKRPLDVSSVHITLSP